MGGPNCPYQPHKLNGGLPHLPAFPKIREERPRTQVTSTNCHEPTVTVTSLTSLCSPEGD